MPKRGPLRFAAPINNVEKTKVVKRREQESKKIYRMRPGDEISTRGRIIPAPIPVPNKKTGFTEYHEKFLHRIDGPAQVGNGHQRWFFQGFLHREGDDPAIIFPDGGLSWYKMGKLHRDTGKPAQVFTNGRREWWVDGKLHRDGNLPAIEHGDIKEFWINGKKV